MTPEARALDAAIRLDPEIWFTHFGKIVTDAGRMIVGPEPTSVQRRMFAHYRKCQIAKKPCKMLVYKSRRHGASTGAQAILYHHAQRNHHAGQEIKLKVMAHKDQSADEVFGLFKTLALGDRFGWIPGVANVAKDLDDEMTLGNGATMFKLSALANEPGRGGAAQGAELTEVAHYRSTGPKDPLTAFLQSVKAALQDPMGVVIADSTPAGANGWFYNQVKGALEQERAGTMTLDDWTFIFEPWWTLPDSSMPFGSQAEVDEFVRTMAQHEIDELDKWGGKGITMEQMKWRRSVINGLLNREPERFKQEYPSDPIEGFLGAGRPRFDAVSIVKAMDVAEGFTPDRGTLDLSDFGGEESVVFVPDADGEIEVLEHPRWGFRYLVAWDTMTGEDQIETLGKHEPDYQSIVVQRDETEDENGKIQPVKIVAKHLSRLPIEMAGEIARRLSLWYGECMIVPEVNNSGLAGVKYLEEKGAPVLKRVRIDARTQKETEQLGWRTDNNTRKTIVDNFARKWREGKVEILFKSILEQMQVFVTNRNGKYEAMDGNHDDEVLAVAIGLWNLPHASERKMAKRHKLGGRRQIDGFRKAAGV